jgi:hypothetical protein
MQARLHLQRVSAFSKSLTNMLLESVVMNGFCTGWAVLEAIAVSQATHARGECKVVLAAVQIFAATTAFSCLL